MTTEEIQNLMDEGRQAYLEGKRLDTNPYDSLDDPMRYNYWRAGFASMDPSLTSLY